MTLDGAATGATIESFRRISSLLLYDIIFDARARSDDRH